MNKKSIDPILNMKCRYGHVTKCKGNAEMVNKWNIPMCEPCHYLWLKRKHMRYRTLTGMRER